MMKLQIKRKQLLVYGYLILTFILWGSLYVVSKYMLGKFSTFTLSFLRFSIAFITLSVIQHKEKVIFEKKDQPWLLVVGVGGYFVAIGFQLLGTKYAGASLASLLNALNPVTITIFGGLLLHETLNWRKGIGILIAIAGVWCILGNNSGLNEIGVICSICSVFLWGVNFSFGKTG